MNIKFSADEVFEIAEQIERNGAKFYHKAAESVTDFQYQKLLIDLAVMEEDHEKIFASMRSEFFRQEQKPTVFDSDNTAVLYLKAFAGGHIFNINVDPSEKLSGNESIVDLIKIAIGLEKDSIVFYLGMKEVIPENLGKDKIDAIIKEEMSHITDLNERLTQFD